MFSLLTRTHARKKTRSALRSTSTDFFFRTHTTTTQIYTKQVWSGSVFALAVMTALSERVEQNDDALHRDWTLFLIRRAFDLRANHWIRCKRGVRVRGGGEGVVEEVFDVAAASLDEAKLDENERRRRGEDDDEDYYAARRRRRSKHPLRRLLPNLPPSISHDVPRRVGRPVSNRHHRVSRGLRSSRRHDRRRVRPRGVHVRRRPRRQTNGRGNQRENGWVVRGSFIRSLWCPRVDSRGIIILYMSCMYSILLL